MRRALWQGLKFIVFGTVFFVLFGALFVLAPIDTRIFRAALTQPLVVFQKSGDNLRLIACICGPTLRPDEVPETVTRALIATEDRRFHSHYGVDPKSFVAALVSGGRRGGSTLEMQLAKNTLNGPAPSYFRKFAELFFATRISLAYSKDDVLRLYLSRVNFGRVSGLPVYGLRDAAQAFFGKPPERLDVAEAAILVAMINAPSYYDPLRHPERTLARARLVVARMQAQGVLSSAPPLAERMPKHARRLPRRDRFLEDQVRRELLAIRADLPDGRHFALTTIDPIAQIQAQTVVASEAKDYLARGVVRAGLITLDGRGRILAMVGGLNYRASNWNLAVQAQRQAASTAKIATYLAALEAGWTRSDTVRDERKAITSKFVPRNVDHRYRGRIPLATCIKESRNVCTMWLAQQVGMAAVSEMAQRIGLTEQPQPGSSVVLGAAETTLLRNTGAFLSVANGGLRQPGFLLRGVLGQNGKLLYRADAGPGARILAPEVAAAMRALLGDVTGPGGTGQAARFGTSPVFGKTGTSQENRDAWFIGFAGHGITTGVWVGPAEGQRMRGVSGGQLPAEIFARYNRNLVERFQGYAEARPDDPESYWRDANLP